MRDYIDKDDDGEQVEVDAPVKGVARKWSLEDMYGVLERLAEGETLPAICADKDYPSSTSFLQYVSRNRELAREYMRARKIRALTWIDDLVRIADDAEADSYLDDNGKPVWNHEHIQRSRLRIQVRQWVIQRDLPELFSAEGPAASDSSTRTKVDAPPQETREEWVKRQQERIKELTEPKVLDPNPKEGE